MLIAARLEQVSSGSIQLKRFATDTVTGDQITDMPATRNPRCFVAMAFDHNDTDAVYDLLIKPTLQRNGIVPIIVNRRQSNDDLNKQIIELLDGSDFCIADLTYARQSVYFEAGYAQRKSPVIYTVRRDHLKRGQPDDLRVHFDLQMK